MGIKHVSRTSVGRANRSKYFQTTFKYLRRVMKGFIPLFEKSESEANKIRPRFAME